MKSKNKNYNYTTIDLKNRLKKIGLKKGDLIFCHSNLAFFGKINSNKNLCKIYFDTILDIIGKQGTLIVPTYTYSIKTVYDVNKTPSVCGAFSEYVRKSKKGIRSLDPIFSVCCVGRHSKYLSNINSLENYECFGKDSFFEKFYKLKGKIINFNDTSASTHIHYFEKLLNVNYRKDKIFKVKIKNRKFLRQKKIIFYCVKNFRNIEARFDKFHTFSLKKNLAKQLKLGLGIITCMKIDNMKKVVFENAKKKNFLYKSIKKF